MIEISKEDLARAEWRKQCGIPIEETATTTIICPEEAVGEIGVTLENGMSLDLPICEGHLEDLTRNYSLKLDSAENSLLQ